MKKIIKRTGIIKVSEDGVAQEIYLKISGTKLNKVETCEIPIYYRPSYYANSYKNLYKLGMNGQ